jgi:hypothetical protein
MLDSLADKMTEPTLHGLFPVSLFFLALMTGQKGHDYGVCFCANPMYTQSIHMSRIMWIQRLLFLELARCCCTIRCDVSQVPFYRLARRYMCIYELHASRGVMCVQYLVLAYEQEAKAIPHALPGRAVGWEMYAVEYAISGSEESLYMPSTPKSSTN